MQGTLFDVPAPVIERASKVTSREVSDAAVDMLRAATIDNNILTTYQAPDREIYEEFNEVLERLRGAWKRGHGHVFPYDPTAAIAAVIESGRMPAKNPLAYFPTPAVLADQLVASLDVDPPKTVLEPSAGAGALVAAVLERWPDAKVTAVELDLLNVAMLDGAGATVIADDFLAVDFGRDRFDVIVMNPPFVVGKDKLAWWTHLQRAIRLLAPGGVVACIAPAGTWRDSTSKRFKSLRAELAKLGAALVEHPDGAFAESGTGVSTCTIVIRDGAAPVAEDSYRSIREDAEPSPSAPAIDDTPPLEVSVVQLLESLREGERATLELLRALSDIPGIDVPGFDMPDDQEWC